ncbi:carboxypeptidase regulatory-like domain-containing protein, partial [Acidobacteriota bacterium]
LHRGCTVSGRVLRPDGSASENFFVVLRNEQNMEAAPENLMKDNKGGLFKLAGIEPGTYTLAAVAEGYAPASPLDLQFREGQHLEGVTLKLRKGSELKGRLIKDSGNGAPHHYVRLVPLEGTNIETRLYNSTPTDADGNFTFEGLPPGMFQIKVQFAGAPPVSRTVKIPEDSYIELRIQNGLSVPVRVLQEDGGEPVEGAYVSLATLEPSASSRDQGCTTSREGTCAINGILPGKYRAAVHDAEASNFSITVDIQPPFTDDVPELLLEIAPTGTLVGRILAPAQALREAVVTIINPSGETNHDATADDEGKFTVYNLVPGLYRVFVHFRSDEGQQIAREVEVESGAVATVEIELAGQGEIHGRVVRTNGEPLSGITVDLSPVATLFISEGGDFSGGRTTAAFDGAYRISGLGPGLYRITALSENSPIGPSSILPFFETVDLRDAPGAFELDLVIPPGILQGMVFDATTGSPLSKALVKVNRLDGKPEYVPELGQTFTYSDVDGVFYFEGIPDKRVRLTASKGGFQSASELVAPSPGKIELGLRPTGSRSLQIVELQSGQSPGSVELLFLDQSENSIRSLTLTPDTQGEFTFMDPGAFAIWIFAPACAAVRVPAGAGAVELPPGGSLDIQVLHEDGVPCPGARVGLEGPQGQVWFNRSLIGPGVNNQLLTDADGFIRLDRLIEGQYEIMASGAEGLAGYAPAMVSIAERQRVEIVLRTTSSEGDVADTE